LYLKNTLKAQLLLLPAKSLSPPLPVLSFCFCIGGEEDATPRACSTQAGTPLPSCPLEKPDTQQRSSHTQYGRSRHRPCSKAAAFEVEVLREEGVIAWAFRSRQDGVRQDGVMGEAERVGGDRGAAGIEEEDEEAACGWVAMAVRCGGGGMGAVVSGVMGEGKGFLMPDAGEMPPRNMGTGLGLGNMPRGPSCVSQGKDTHAGMMSS
jgi:hypothetical protein